MEHPEEGSEYYEISGPDNFTLTLKVAPEDFDGDINIALTEDGSSTATDYVEVANSTTSVEDGYLVIEYEFEIKNSGTNYGVDVTASSGTKSATLKTYITND